MNTKFIIIDDDAIYRMMAKLIINKLDTSLLVEQYENGDLALEKLGAIKNNTDKIIILLDINMPLLDGWDFLEEIEKNKKININQLEIFMVSSSVFESDFIKSQQYSIVKGFLQKPLKNQHIIDLISMD